MPTRIRAKVADRVTVRNRTLAEGEEIDCPNDLARRLVAQGVAELADAPAERSAAGRTARGDVTETATNKAATAAERTTKKG